MREVALLLGFICIIVLASYMFFPSDPALLNAQPHPFLVLSVILASYYGLKIAILSSVVCTLTYLGLLHYQVDYSVVETIFEYQYLVLPVSWTFISLIVGEFKQISLNQNLVLHENDKASKKIILNLKNDLKSKNIELNELSLRLVSKEDTIQKNLDIAKGLLEIAPGKLIKNLIQAIRLEAQAQSVAFYQMNYQSQTLERVDVSGEEGDFHPIINLESEDVSLFSIAVQEKRLVTLEDCEFSSSVKKDGVSLLSPILKDKQVFGVIALKGIPFLKYVPTLFSIVEMYCKWAEESLKHAYLFQKLKENSFWDIERESFEKGFFNQVCKDFSKDKNASLEILKVNINKKDRQSLNMTILSSLLKNKIKPLYYVDYLASEVYILVSKSLLEKQVNDLIKEFSKYSEVNLLKFSRLSLDFNEEKEVLL